MELSISTPLKHLKNPSRTLPDMPPRTTKPKPAPRRQRMGMFVILHGTTNSGKTSTAAAAKDPYFVHDPDERGILRLLDAGQVSLDEKYVKCASDWTKLIDLVRHFPDNRQTLVLDAATGFQHLAYVHVAYDDFGGNMTASGEGFFAWQKGPKRVAHNEWPRQLLRSLCELTNRGKDVILIAHSHAKIMKNPAGQDYEKYVPYLDNDIWMHTVKDAQYVLFVGRDLSVHKKKVDTQQFASRIFIGPNPAYETKSLPLIETPSIPMGDSGAEAWHNFLQKIGRA